MSHFSSITSSGSTSEHPKRILAPLLTQQQTDCGTTSVYLPVLHRINRTNAVHVNVASLSEKCSSTCYDSQFWSSFSFFCLDQRSKHKERQLSWCEKTTSCMRWHDRRERKCLVIFLRQNPILCWQDVLKLSDSCRGSCIVCRQKRGTSPLTLGPFTYRPTRGVLRGNIYISYHWRFTFLLLESF